MRCNNRAIGTQVRKDETRGHLFDEGARLTGNMPPVEEPEEDMSKHESKQDTDGNDVTVRRIWAGAEVTIRYFFDGARPIANQLPVEEPEAETLKLLQAKSPKSDGAITTNEKHENQNTKDSNTSKIQGKENQNEHGKILRRRSESSSSF